MGKNLEIKLRVDSHQQLVDKLKEIDASFSNVLEQKDIYYSFGKGLLKLRIVNGEYELIKYVRDESGANRWSNYEIIYLTGNNVERYLSEIFREEVVVQKTRTLYMYKDTRIHLDEVKNLGSFIELEAVVVDTEKEAADQFNFLVEHLELDLNAQINKSYKELMISNADN